MRIAIVTAIFHQINGPELTAVQLGEALDRSGADVTLFAPADFHTSLKHIPTIERSLWSMNDLTSKSALEKRNLFVSSQIKVLQYQDQFDIVHIGFQRYAFAIGSHLRIPGVVLLNGRIDERDLRQLKQVGLTTVALTEKYRAAIGADYAIHIGFDIKEITPSYTPGSGLIMIGRITEQKGTHQAILIARAAGKKLLLIGRVSPSKEDQSYYQNKVRPFIDGLHVTHIENVPNKDISKYISAAEALFFPIIRPETFGRVIGESLACGTPVIGTATDPLPELLTDPRVSFLSNNIDALIDAAKHTERFDRKACRKYAEEKFDIRKIAGKYILLYEKVIQEHGK